MIISIDGTIGSLVQPFNPAKVFELMVSALTAAGYTFPPLSAVLPEPTNTTLTVSFEDGTYSQQQIGAMIAILDAVAADPTRNDPTEDQQEAIDLQNKLDNAIADIAVINAVPGGLKDQINAVTTGLKDRLLTNAAWNALTTDAQADLLRQVQRDTLTLVVDVLNVVLRGARADKFELRYIQQQEEE